MKKNKQTNPIGNSSAIANEAIVEEKKINLSSNNYWGYAILSLAILITLIARFRLLGTALERDEGEFGYIAQLILEGKSPFTAYNYKIPGVSYVYALFMSIFGETKEGIHWSLLFFNLGTTVTLFFMLKKRFSSLVASLSSLCFALMSTSSATLGHAAHATQYLIFFSILGLYLLFQYLDTKKWYYAIFGGLSLGVSFLMKQPAAFFILIGGLYVVSAIWLASQENSERFKQIIVFGLIYSVGVLLPYLAIVLLSVSYGQFDLFWKWTYTYPKELATILSFDDGMSTLKIMIPFVTKGFEPIWVLGIIGWIVSIFHIKEWNKRIFLILFFVFSFISVTPGYYFRNHYFITILPALSLGFALLFEALGAWLTKMKLPSIIAAVVPSLLVFYSIGKNADYLFKNDTEVVVKNIYGSNPFLEMEKIGDYIDKNAKPTDKVAVFGSEAEVYFYSKRKAATGYLFVYEMMKNQPNNMLMQKEMLAEIEKNDPNYLVLASVGASWGRAANVPDSLSTWFNNAVNTKYSVVGVADILNAETVYKFDADALNYRPTSDAFVAVFKKLEK